MFYSFSSMIIMKFQPGQKSRNFMEKRRLATLCLYTIRIQLVGKQIESCIAKTPIATGLVSLVQTDPDSKYLQTFTNMRVFAVECESFSIFYPNQSVKCSPFICHTSDLATRTFGLFLLIGHPFPVKVNFNKKKIFPNIQVKHNPLMIPHESIFVPMLTFM